MTEPASTSEPMLTVIKGNPTPEELAAVLAVVASQRHELPAPPKPVDKTGWAARWRSVRAPIQPGPGAWRASLRD